jgi:hypothetical protein
MDLLDSVTEGHWGILDAVTNDVPTKAGWRKESDGKWTVTQAAQLDGTRGLAVLTTGQADQAAGQKAIEGVARHALAPSPTASAAGAGAAPCVPGGMGSGDCSGQHYTGPTVAGIKAQISADGAAIPPDQAPEAVKCMIAAGNRIHTTFYSQSAPHGTPYTKILDHYDCSSSTSYLMYWGGYIKNPNQSLVSGNYVNWGDKGKGSWVTLYANDGHVFTHIAGIRFDTGGSGYPGRAGPAGTGPRWNSTLRRDTSGFTEVHPPGL